MINVVYCGDKGIEDGLIISVLSLAKQTREALGVYVLTMRLEYDCSVYMPVSERTIAVLGERIKKVNPESFIRLIDVGEAFLAAPPIANMTTRFTPYCMLRLYMDQVEGLPDRVLYLDNDVICHADFSDFYHQDISDVEFVGVHDFYGRWTFIRREYKRSYVNSGVLLMNMAKIRETGLIARCRDVCAQQRLFLPDQTALNKCVTAKRIAPRQYNEQRQCRPDTVFRHFSTSFRVLPWPRVISVKPWQIDRMHRVLHLHDYDDLLREYQHIKNQVTLKVYRYENN